MGRGGWRGRWRPTLRVVAYLALFFALTQLAELALLLLLLATGVLRVVPALETLTTSPLVLPLYGAGLLAALGVTWAFARLLDHRPLLDFGLRPGGPWLRDAAAGFGLGALLMALIFVVELGAGWYRLEAVEWGAEPLDQVVSRLAVALLFFVMVAFLEELSFRGYVLQNLERAWGSLVALFASSAVFAAFHLLNPGAGVIPVLALVIAGLMLGSGYLVTRALWLPIGLHLAWNFFQGPVFGFPVSGTAAGVLLRLVPAGPDAVTGGPFGPEASLIGVAAEVAGLALLWLWSQRRWPRQEPAEARARMGAGRIS